LKISWNGLLTFTLIVCAVTTTGILARREFSPSPQRMPPKDVFIDNWRVGLSKGVLLGEAAAPVQLIEFADFECPFCAAFNETFKAVRQQYPSQVALTFVEFPLVQHKFATLAAQMAECAGRQQRFERMLDLLFESQQQFGLKPWSDLAKEAGIEDIPAFETCFHSQSSTQLVDAGKKLGGELNIQGTPTIIINGWMLGRAPTIDALHDMVKAILAGKSPVVAPRKS
jgi:protein-disulfide isomerase